MKNYTAVQLPKLFDAKLLQEDLEKVKPAEWIKHFRGDHYEGGWSVAPLRSVGGHPAIIYSTPAGSLPDFYKNTPILERCPTFQAVINWFECQVNGVRLMCLDAGSQILEHTDEMDAGDLSEFRIHVPISTNPWVEFWVNGQLLPMQEGEIWYADFNTPHSVKNDGPTPRIHLVLDCTPNDWLLEQMEKGNNIEKMTHFLREIGMKTSAAILSEDTFLPGVKIENGDIIYDPAKLDHPGDLLHEAGHIAMKPSAERYKLNGNIGDGDENALGEEIGAILWSYAAVKNIGLPANLVFHEKGYRGASDWYLANFETEKNYIGLPYLTWLGLAASADQTEKLGYPAFPAMLRWLRE